jgi:adenylate kinase family enzyme
LNLPDSPVVSVSTTDNRGHKPEEIVERCLDRIISISDQAPPAIRDQAHAFKDAIRPLLLHYMKEAVNSDRTTMYNVLRENGHTEVAELIRRM